MFILQEAIAAAFGLMMLLGVCTLATTPIFALLIFKLFLKKFPNLALTKGNPKRILFVFLSTIIALGISFSVIFGLIYLILTIGNFHWD